jgi:heme-degrading monooxygenase HmoA
MIARIWRGWAPPDAAGAYQRYFERTLAPELAGIPGFRHAHLLRRDGAGAGDQVELVTVTWFDSLDAVRRFAGEDHERAVVSEHARSLLTRYDRTCRHFVLAAETESGAPANDPPRTR